MTTEVGEYFLLHRTTKEIWEVARQTYTGTRINYQETFATIAKLNTLRVPLSCCKSRLALIPTQCQKCLHGWRS